MEEEELKLTKWRWKFLICLSKVATFDQNMIVKTLISSNHQYIIFILTYKIFPKIWGRVCGYVRRFYFFKNVCLGEKMGVCKHVNVKILRY